MNIINGDNLEVMRSLEGQKFDLVELDGPYMAGLEDWDNLTEQEYIQHYAERLTALREVLQPWSVVFLFGYPEGCAEIKSWTNKTGTLYLRRWITWYKQITAHKGRKVECISLFMPNKPQARHFGAYIRGRREAKGLSAKKLGLIVDGVETGRVGKGLYEAPHGKYLPPQDKFIRICSALGINPLPWWGVVDFTFPGLTDID
jgi:hypothetical protein